MTLAKYTIQIPTTDNEGNQLADLASAAHESLFRYGPQSNQVQGTKIYRGVAGNWRSDAQEIFDELITYAEDTPEMDSTMKELATHVAEIANQWGVMVFKEGEDAPKMWMMQHPNATGEGPADPSALSGGVASDALTAALKTRKAPI